jgi:uncharacterized protein YdaU (DUF1376 family)
MAQNRPAPAYQEYAAAMLANIHFRMLEPAERGILYTMRLECWVNHGLPTNPVMLAKILGADPGEVAAALPALKSFFREENNLLISPELEDYRAHLANSRAKQSEGGKKSAANKKGTGKSSETTAAQGAKGKASNLQGTYKHPSSNLQVLSTVQPSSFQPSQTQSLEKGLPDELIPWANDYDKASNGN